MTALGVTVIAILVEFTVAGNCDVPIDGETCYYTSLSQSEKQYDLSEAWTFCKNSGGRLAQIPNSDAYEKLTEYIRSLIPSSQDSVEVWTGLEVDPLNNGAVSNARGNTFTYWNPSGGLSTGVSFWEATNVYLFVDIDADNTDQGMVNYRPSEKLDGVVCETVA